MEMLELAAVAADAFALNHPGEVERDELISEAVLAVLRWTEINGRSPEPAHALRLMKSRLYDVHRRRAGRDLGLT